MAIDNTRSRSRKPVNRSHCVLRPDHADTNLLYDSVVPPAILALISGPILSIIGGILGFSAVLQYSLEHGHATIARA